MHLDICAVLACASGWGVSSPVGKSNQVESNQELPSGLHGAGAKQGLRRFLDMGYKRCSSSEKLRGLSARAQARRKIENLKNQELLPGIHGASAKQGP